MKTCPICKTTLFEDMPVCYGCMYEFGSKPGLEREQQQQGHAQQRPGNEKSKGPGTAGASSAAAEDAEGRGRWSLRLEMRTGGASEPSWAVELQPPVGAEPPDEPMVEVTAPSDRP